jgi:WD40 repeat protein
VCAVFTADGRSLLWWDGRGVAIWDLAAGKVVGTIDTGAWQFTLSPDARLLAADAQGAAIGGGGEAVIRIYDVATRQELKKLTPLPELGGSLFRTCGFDATASKFFTRSDVDVQVWDTKTWKMLRRLPRKEPPANNASAHSPRGGYLTLDPPKSAFTDLLDTRTEKFIPIRADITAIARLAGGRGPGGVAMTSVADWTFSGDERMVWGADEMNGLLLGWSLPQGKLTVGRKIPDLVFAKVSPDGSRIVASLRHKEPTVLRVLDGKTLRVQATLGPMKDDVSWFALSPRWAFAAGGGECRLWDLGGPAATVAPATATAPRR